MPAASEPEWACSRLQKADWTASTSDLTSISWPAACVASTPGPGTHSAGQLAAWQPMVWCRGSPDWPRPAATLAEKALKRKVGPRWPSSASSSGQQSAAPRPTTGPASSTFPPLQWLARPLGNGWNRPRNEPAAAVITAQAQRYSRAKRFAQYLEAAVEPRPGRHHPPEPMVAARGADALAAM
jgi:hypothetical protein